MKAIQIRLRCITSVFNKSIIITDADIRDSLLTPEANLHFVVVQDQAKELRQIAYSWMDSGILSP